MSWTGLLLRHLRGSALRWAALAAVVAVASALVMLWPRWLDRTATTELQRDLGTTSAPLVDPSIVTPWLALWSESDVPVAEVHAALWAPILDPVQAYRDTLPEPLRSLLGEPLAHAWQAPVNAPDPTVRDRAAMLLQPAYSFGLDEHADYVEGRPPTVEPVTEGIWDELVGGASEKLRLEFAVSVEAAEELRWAVGDARTLVTALPGATQVEAVLVGTFEADDAGSDFWQHSGLLLRPTVVDDPNAGIVVTARAVIAAGRATAIAPMLSQPETARIWYPLDVEAIRGATAADVARQLEDHLATVPQQFGPPFQVATEAPAIIDAVLGRRVATEAVLGLAVAAPAGVLLALLALAAQVIVAPRQGALNLVRERGAAARQTRWLLGAEAALVSLPAAAVGAAAAVILLPAAMSPWWWAAPVVIAVAPVVSLLGGSRTPRPRLRLVAEIALGVLAAAGAGLLGQRGVTAAGADPLGVATPLLLALIVAVVCTRLLPVLLRPLARRLAARPDLVAPLGAALAVRRRPSVVAAMAMLAGTAVAVLGVLATATLVEARQEAALRDVGAAVRVTGYLPGEALDRLRALDGVTALAGVTSIGIVPITGASVGTGFTTVHAVDATLADVQGDLPGAIAVPGTGPVGAVVSDRLGPGVGDEIEVYLGGPLTAVVTDVAASVPGVAATGGWVVLDRQVLVDAGQDVRTTTTLLAVSPGADVAAAVREIVGPVPTVTTYGQRVAELGEAPTAGALSTGLLVAGAIGLGSAAGAVALGLARRDGDRTRIVAVLRTMGLPPRAEVRLVLWETVPLLAVAVAAGVGLGFGLAGLVIASTDLRPFTGGAAQPVLVIDPAGLVAALGLVLVVATVAVVVSAWAAAGRSAAVVLRAGEEPT